MINDKELTRIIGENITRILKLRNRTQLELAEYIGASPATVSYWCNGLKSPRMNKIDMICDFLRVPRSAILEEQSGIIDSFTAQEKEIINAYRLADEITKKNILKLLDMI